MLKLFNEKLQIKKDPWFDIFTILDLEENTMMTLEEFKRANTRKASIFNLEVKESKKTLWHFLGKEPDWIM